MNKKNPIISIIVPVYNVERYLNKCIESILNQTFKEFELILVNDGSTDSSGRICEEYKNLDSRVIVIHKSNGGQGSARNLALDIAQGEYIGFVDSDDYIEDDMYDFLYNLIIENNADIAICNAYKEKQQKKEYKFKYYPREIMSHSQAIKELLIYEKFGNSVCDKLYKKHLFENLRFPLFKAYEDNFLVYKLIERAKIVSYEGVPKYNHVYRENSTTNSMVRKESKYYYMSKKNIYMDLKYKYPELEFNLFNQYYWSLWEFINDILRNKRKDQLQEEFNEVIRELKNIKLNNKNLKIKQKFRLLLIKVNPELYFSYLERKLLGGINENN